MELQHGSVMLACLWAASSLAVVAWAAQSCFAWLELAPRNDAMARLIRTLCAGASLGAGIWAAHGIGMSISTAGALAGYRLDSELAVWLLASGAGAAAFGWCDLRQKKSRRWVAIGIALGIAIVAIQMIGVLAGDWVPEVEWQFGIVALAALASVGGCLLAFGSLNSFRSVDQRIQLRVRVAAGLIFSIGAAAAQYLVVNAAKLPSQGGSVSFGWRVPGIGLSAFAALSSIAVLWALHVSLRRRVLKKHVQLKASRRIDTGVLNDPLTGLPTRQMFEGTLAQAVKQADTAQRRLAVLVVNLDGFKPINQSFGHLGGDVVLREVASRVRALGKPHMTARLAGDEFLILVTEDPQAEDASALAFRVIAEIGRPYRIEKREVSLSCSIGVAMYPAHGAMSALITHAQAAMSAAKGAGGAGHAFFEPRMIKGQRDEVELLRDLRVALDLGQMELYYQPKIHAPSGEITGAEALMRWHHPKRGVVSPSIFIPIAERYGLINGLGRWLIDEACRQARDWRDEGLRMRVAINLSVHQLRQVDLSERIAAALKRNQINPDLITCEITESSAMDDTEVTTRVLGQLDKVGVHIAIDDFGTGHSSLSYLRKLPADELKIDRSFVLDLETSEEARKVATAVINLAKALNLKVVAEGVETEGQNQILRDLGCDQLQGFLFAKPMSAKALARWAMDDEGPRTMNFRASLFRPTVQAKHSGLFEGS